MPYFDPDFLQFFTELKQNNTKEWFDQNRIRYTKNVKTPFSNFVDEMIQRIQAFDPDLQIEAKDCILRINRDIRFSKDKTPYNLYVTAFISKGGRKDKSLPGFFIRFTPKELGIMGGCFMPDKDQLEKIRSAISSNPKVFDGLIGNSDFQKKYGELKGEEAKRLPSQWKDAVERIPVIAKKQYYFTAMLNSELLFNENLPELLMEYWHAARPMNLFLEKAINAI